MKLKIETEHHQNIVELKLYGEVFTEDEYAPLIDAVNSHLADNKSKFILNLEGMTYMNSLGLNSLIKSFTAIRNSGGDMEIVNISKKINQVLLLTKLNSVLNIATSHKNALEKLNK
ncbi:MAG: STAS domain-containing protein [Crocinitomicaceae bacterium]